jgi:N-acetyl sugar amidotransferase
MYRQCVRCVMDSSDPKINFDGAGNCNHCVGLLQLKDTLIKKHKFGTGHLEKIITKIKSAGANKKYDAVLGISGGVDSCYLAYQLKKHGLRVLLVHMDNGWNSEEAVHNIKTMVQNLGFDYESYVLDWEEFRDLQIAFLKASVPEIETPTDIAIPGALHKIAAKHGIRYIISGGNIASEGMMPATWHYNPKDTRYIKTIHRKFGSGNLRKFPLFKYTYEFYCKFFKGIHMVYLLNYIDYDKTLAQDEMEEQFGWKRYGGKHYESRFTRFVQSYILPVKFNIDYRRLYLSTQICFNKITKAEALEILKAPMYNKEVAEKEAAFVCKKLGLTNEAFEEIMATAPKYYFDYKNDEKKLNFIYSFYNKLFK